jgi:hypothetical protein
MTPDPEVAGIVETVLGRVGGILSNALDKARADPNIVCTELARAMVERRDSAFIALREGKVREAIGGLYEMVNIAALARDYCLSKGVWQSETVRGILGR